MCSNLPLSMFVRSHRVTSFCIIADEFQTFILYRTQSPGEIFSMLIPDRVCAAIVGLNCDVVCAVFM